MGHLHRLSKNASYELRNCGGCGRFVQGMSEIEAERGGKCKMQPKLLLIAALLSWASSSVTYASAITVFNDFGPGNINDGGMLGRTVRSCATTIPILSEGGKHEAVTAPHFNLQRCNHTAQRDQHPRRRLTAGTAPPD